MELRRSPPRGRPGRATQRPRSAWRAEESERQLSIGTTLCHLASAAPGRTMTTQLLEVLNNPYRFILPQRIAAAPFETTRLGARQAGSSALAMPAEQCFPRSDAAPPAGATRDPALGWSGTAVILERSNSLARLRQSFDL